eukprot:scaffold20210_cov113-Isochrysis_galbana.AAC.4
MLVREMRSAVQVRVAGRHGKAREWREARLRCESRRRVAVQGHSTGGALGGLPGHPGRRLFLRLGQRVDQPAQHNANFARHPALLRRHPALLRRHPALLRRYPAHLHLGLARLRLRPPHLPPDRQLHSARLSLGRRVSLPRSLGRFALDRPDHIATEPLHGGADIGHVPALRVVRLALPPLLLSGLLPPPRLLLRSPGLSGRICRRRDTDAPSLARHPTLRHDEVEGGPRQPHRQTGANANVLGHDDAHFDRLRLWRLRWPRTARSVARSARQMRWAMRERGLAAAATSADSAVAEAAMSDAETVPWPSLLAAAASPPTAGGTEAESGALPPEPPAAGRCPARDDPGGSPASSPSSSAKTRPSRHSTESRLNAPPDVLDSSVPTPSSSATVHRRHRPAPPPALRTVATELIPSGAVGSGLSHPTHTSHEAEDMHAGSRRALRQRRGGGGASAPPPAAPAVVEPQVACRAVSPAAPEPELPPSRAAPGSEAAALDPAPVDRPTGGAAERWAAAGAAAAGRDVPVRRWLAFGGPAASPAGRPRLRAVTTPTRTPCPARAPRRLVLLPLVAAWWLGAPVATDPPAPHWRRPPTPPDPSADAPASPSVASTPAVSTPASRGRFMSLPAAGAPAERFAVAAPPPACGGGTEPAAPRAAFRAAAAQRTDERAGEDPAATSPLAGVPRGWRGRPATLPEALDGAGEKGSGVISCAAVPSATCTHVTFPALPPPPRSTVTAPGALLPPVLVAAAFQPRPCPDPHIQPSPSDPQSPGAPWQPGAWRAGAPGILPAS